MKERRISNRISSKLNATYKVADQTHQAKVSDISLEGLGFVSEKHLEKNSSIDLHIALGSQTVSIVLGIIWSLKDGDLPSYRHGAKILGGQKDALQRYYSDQIKDKLEK